MYFYSLSKDLHLPSQISFVFNGAEIRKKVFSKYDEQK